MLSIKWFKGNEDDLSDAFAVRREVFINEQKISPENEFTGDDVDCIHIVMYDGEQPIATGRVLLGDNDFKIGRVATIAAYRGRGIATNIVQSLIGACNAMGGSRQYVHAQTAAKAFYEKLGFAVCGEECEIAGVKHVEMERFGGAGKCCGSGGHCGGCR
ncbi:MAG: GNAT family N-acetyltransferase [Defluviitaleaceae bacterium]|nr:GNAT family N-acetyltransferase [Defluviitaleaceae bacterium]